jgi:Fe-S-cluster containining protein
MKRIARKLGISPETFATTYVKVVPTKDGHILQSSADACPFLQWDEKRIKATCSIHSSRPKACRDWVPSLSRTECQEGLAKLKNGGELLLLADIYGSNREIERLTSAVRDIEDV